MALAKPAQILGMAGDIGKLRGETGSRRTLLLAFLAGAYIAFGGMLMVTVVAGLPQQTFGTFAKLVGGSLFPIGLILVIIGGGDLFTGNALFNTVGVAQGKLSISNALRNLFLSYIGNFIGAVFIAYFLSTATGLLTAEPWLTWIEKMAVSKSNLSFNEAFWRGVGANWLVALACWLALASDNVTGKVVGIWFSVMTFVAIGFEHSVANMFFIPLGIFVGAPVSWEQFLIYNEIPVTLGNIVGGSVFCGAAYLLGYRNKTKAIAEKYKKIADVPA